MSNGEDKNSERSQTEVPVRLEDDTEALVLKRGFVTVV